MAKGGFFISGRAAMFQIIASLLLLVVFALAETHPFFGVINGAAPSCFTVVGVKEGDTCFDIAKTYNVSTKDFNAINPNLNCTSLFVGQWLCIEGSVN